jgi:hypothetical protein
MLAGRPHEAAGNGSPRWMAAGPRKRAHRTRPTGRLARRLPAGLRLRAHEALLFCSCSARAGARAWSTAFAAAYRELRASAQGRSRNLRASVTHVQAARLINF